MKKNIGWFCNLINLSWLDTILFFLSQFKNLYSHGEEQVTIYFTCDMVSHIAYLVQKLEKKRLTKHKNNFFRRSF